MIFNSGWTKENIWSLTYRELFEYVNLYNKHETEKLFDFIKVYSIYNVRAISVGTNGKKKDIMKFIDSMKNSRTTVKQENDLDDQFEGLDFG